MRKTPKPVTTAYLGLGSNLGDRLSMLTRAVDLLHKTPGIRVCAVSSAYETRPVGPPQPEYLNAALLVETDLEPEDLLEACHGVEAVLGRTRNGETWSARTIDIDVLFFGDLCLVSPEIRIPHPEITHREFVIKPLVEINPWIEHPVLRTPLKRLLESGLAQPQVIRNCGRFWDLN